MRAWYDILSIERTDSEDGDGICTSALAVGALIEKEIDRGITSEKIILAGFSQGGAIALHTALRYPHRLAGVLALSTYLPLRRTLAAERSAMNVSIPIFMAHGIYDPVIPKSRALKAKEILLKHGYDVAWHSYPMDHSVCVDEIADISSWLTASLS